MTINIDNPSPFEKELLEFLKQQKQELEELTVDTLKSFIGSFQKKQTLNYKKRDITKHLSTITSDEDEPRDKRIELYSHIEDSAEYIHNLRRV
jgi:hypothetical protein